MSITEMKADNLIRLLEGMSLLKDRDQKQIVSVVDALAFAYEEANAVDVFHCEKQKCMSL